MCLRFMQLYDSIQHVWQLIRLVNGLKCSHIPYFHVHLKKYSEHTKRKKKQNKIN